MGLYTKYEEKWIDQTFDSTVNNVASVISRNTDGLRSVMILGGYGRGEGSIILNGDHSFKLVNDLDLVAVVDKNPTKAMTSRIACEIRKVISDHNNNIKVPSHFEIDIRYLRPNRLDFPDIWFYDLKKSGRVVYGEDLRERVSYNANDIPLSSGFRILFQKVTALLKFSPYQHIIGKEMTKEDYEIMVYACLKTFVEIGTTLCILAKKYKPGYLARVEVLHGVYAEEFTELARQIPELPMLVEMATNFKLNPDYGSLGNYLKAFGCTDLVDLWFKAREVLERYILFYVSRFANTQLTTISRLPEACEILSKIYYIAMLRSLVSNRYALSSNSFVKILNRTYQLLMNVQYIGNIRRETGRIHLAPMQKPISPSLKFYPAGALILFSLNRDGSVNEQYLERALNLLHYCLPVNYLDKIDIRAWKDAKELYFKAYDLYDGMR